MPSTETEVQEMDASVVLPDGVTAPPTAGSREALTPVMRRILRREAVFRRTLVAADVFALLAAFAIGPVVVGGAAPKPALVAFPIALIALVKAMGLYDRDANLLAKRTLTELPSLVGIASLVTLGSWLVAPAILEGEHGRTGVAVFGLSFLALLITARTAARETARHRAAPERCLLVGDGRAIEELSAKLAHSRVVKTEVLMAPAVEGDGATGHGREPTFAAALEERIDRGRIERVVLTVDLIESGDILDTIRSLQLRGVRVSLLPRTARVPGSVVELDQIDGVNLYGVKASEITRSSRALKRSLDLVVSIGGLLFLSPLLLLIAGAIKLESRGAVIYRQVRVGRDGQLFSILKFRTMADGAHAERDSLEPLNAAGELFKMVDDPRVTRVGRWLRRASLDEVPQLVNVLRGEMSLVGPRPLVPEEDRLVVGHYRARLDVSPGMTGHWQVLGSWRIPLGEMVKLDHQYVAKWSLWGDLELLLRTLGHVLRRRGA